MTNDIQLRTFIAEACQWTRVHTRQGSDNLIGIPPAGSRYVCIGGSNEWCFVPNYPEDLNAMHEAKKATLITTALQLRVKWINQLRQIVGRRIDKPSDIDLVNAEAHEQAEALARALGGWTGGFT